MKKILLVVFALLMMGVNEIFSQVVKVENGLSLSWMKGDNLENKLSAYSVMLGCDYLEHDWFYLSSEIGYIKKGGKDNVYDRFYEEDNYASVGYAGIKSKLNYLHINTSFRVKHSFDKLTIYAGIAPTIDFLLKEKSNTKFEDKEYKEDFNANKVVLGIKPEIGVFYDINKIRISLNVSYLRNITHIAKIGELNYPHFEEKNRQGYINNNTLLMSVGIGYRL